MSLKWSIAQKAERKWWQNYLKHKDVKPYLEWKKKYWLNLIDTIYKVTPIPHNALILDAGCGPAGIFMAFHENKIVAFDPLIASYENDLPHFKKNMYTNVEFHTTGVEDFNYDMQFDFIFCMNAINHVKDIAKGYSNLIRLLKPNGYLIITIDAHNYQFFKYLFRLLPGDILHPCQYDLNEYENFITQNNCSIVSTHQIKHEFLFDHYLQIAIKH